MYDCNVFETTARTVVGPLVQKWLVSLFALGPSSLMVGFCRHARRLHPTKATSVVDT